MATPAHSTKLRRLERIVPAQRAVEGGGFEVFRPFPTGVLAGLRGSWLCRAVTWCFAGGLARSEVGVVAVGG